MRAMCPPTLFSSAIYILRTNMNQNYGGRVGDVEQWESTSEWLMHDISLKTGGCAYNGFAPYC